MPYNLRSRSKPQGEEEVQYDGLFQPDTTRYFNNTVDPNPIRVDLTEESQINQDNEIPFQFGQNSEEWVLDSYDDNLQATSRSLDEQPAQPCSCPCPERSYSAPGIFDKTYSCNEWVADYDWSSSVIEDINNELRNTESQTDSIQTQDRSTSVSTDNCSQQTQNCNVYNASLEQEEPPSECYEQYDHCGFKSFCEKLSLRKSIDGTYYLSVKDVFRYVTLGGFLSQEDFYNVERLVEENIFGSRRFPSHEKLDVYSNFQNIMGDREPDIIKVIPYTWKHYRRIARTCLTYSRDNYDYISTLLDKRL